MTLIVAIASEHGFRLIGDKRTINLADGTYTDDTRKVFYSDKHHLGIAIASAAVLNVDDNPANAVSVSDIIQAFLSKLDEKDTALVLQYLDTQGIQFIFSKLQAYVNAIYGEVSLYDLVTGVDFLFSCFINQKPVIASYNQNNVDLVLLKNKPVNKETFVELMYKMGVSKALIFLEDTNQMAHFDRRRNKLGLFEALSCQDIKATLNIGSANNNKRSITRSELLALKDILGVLDVPIYLDVFDHNDFSHNNIGVNYCFLSNESSIVFSAIIKNADASNLANCSDINIMLNTDGFIHSVIIDSANQINTEKPNSVGKTFDSIHARCLGGQYHHDLSIFQINAAGTTIEGHPTAINP